MRSYRFELLIVISLTLASILGQISGLRLQADPRDLSNDEFIARLHRQLNEPNEPMVQNGGTSGTSERLWHEVRQRQKQLQRLQNYFGPGVAEALNQLQDEQQPLSSNPMQSPLEAFALQAKTRVAHEPLLTRQAAPPSVLLLDNDNEPVDALRKYHFMPNNEDSPFVSQSQKGLMFEHMLQEAEADKSANVRARQTQLEQASQFPLQQLLSMQKQYETAAEDPQVNQDELTAMLRHAPLEAILAQAQAEAAQQAAHKRPAEAADHKRPSSEFHRDAQKALRQHQQKEQQLRQSMVKKQAETSQGRAEVEPPQHFKTQLKKIEISQQNGKQLRKEESYEQSVQLSPSDASKAAVHDAHEESAPSHMEQSTYQVQQPISVQLRNAPDHQRATSTHALASKLTSFGDLYFLVLVVGCSMASIMSVVGAGICFYRFQQHHKATADVDYPAYGVIGPVSKPPISPGAQQPLQVDLKGKGSDSRKNPSNASDGRPASAAGSATTANQDSESAGSEAPNGDRKLAQSAQMYHYQHQKQQMIASEK
jgi:hypothetical protein